MVEAFHAGLSESCWKEQAEIDNSIYTFCAESNENDVRKKLKCQPCGVSVFLFEIGMKNQLLPLWDDKRRNIVYNKYISVVVLGDPGHLYDN